MINSFRKKVRYSDSVYIVNVSMESACEEQLDSHNVVEYAPEINVPKKL